MAKVIDFAERKNAAGGPSSPPIPWRDARETWRGPDVKGQAASINVDNVECLLMHWYIWYARIPRGQKLKSSYIVELP